MDYLNLTNNSDYALPEDISLWSEEIQTIFETKYPNLANYSPTVQLNKVDKRGFGFGSIIVRRGNLTLYFPVIINKFQIAPLDTFILNGRYFPADSRIISLVFSGTFGPVAGRTSDDQRISNSMTNFLFSPYYFPVGVKNASGLPDSYPLDIKNTRNFLTKIAYSLTNNSIRSLLAKLSDPVLLSIIKSNPTITDFLTGLSNVPSDVQLAARAAVTYPKNIVQFRYDNGNYYVLLNSSDMFAPTEVSIPSGNIRDAVRQLTGIVDDKTINDIIENVVNDGMITATLPTFRTGVIKILDDTAPLRPTIIDSTCNALVQDENGKYRSGTVFSSIVEFKDMTSSNSLLVKRENDVLYIWPTSFEKPSKVDYKVYIDSQVGMIAEKFIGFKVSNRNLNIITLPSPGDSGVLLDSKSGNISEPFVVLAVNKKYRDFRHDYEYTLKIQTFKGEPYTISYLPLSGQKDDINFIPIRKLINAGQDLNLMVPEIITKIRITFDSGKFAMDLPTDMNNWPKEAFGDFAPHKIFNFQNLSPKDLEFLLVSGGASVKEASAIKYYATKKGSIEVTGLKYIKPIERELRLKYASMLKNAVPTQPIELVKLAADAGGDEVTVAEVFGLSLLTPENASEFIENIPTYNQIMHNISKYIIFARMALKNVDLSNAIKLRDTILDVIQSLVLLNFYVNSNQAQNPADYTNQIE